MAMTEIPLIAGPQTLRAVLGGAEYLLALRWRDAAMGGWVLDVADAAGTPLVAGIAMVTGTDLLGQHRHLGFTGGLYLVGVPDADAVPGFAGLGTDGRLVFVDDDA